MPRKGHKILIEAVKILNEKIKDFDKRFCFIIEGKGPAFKEIKKI